MSGARTRDEINSMTAHEISNTVCLSNSSNNASPLVKTVTTPFTTGRSINTVPVLISSLMDGTLSISGASFKSSFNSLNVNILTTFLPFGLRVVKPSLLQHKSALDSPVFFEREQELFFVPVLPLHISQREPVETQVNCIQFF